MIEDEVIQYVETEDATPKPAADGGMIGALGKGKGKGKDDWWKGEGKGDEGKG